MYFMPPTTSVFMSDRSALTGVRPASIMTRLAMTAIKLSALRAKVHGIPTAAMRIPPNAGPMTLAMLKSVLLSATALVTAVLSRTCSETNA